MKPSRTWLLASTRFLPPWLSNAALAGVFVVLWTQPDLFGWDGARDLQALMFIEFGVVTASFFILAGHGAPLVALPAAVVAIVLGVGLASYIGPIFAGLVALHWVARTMVIWRNEGGAREAVWTFGLSLICLGVAWALTGFLPLPEYEWTRSVVPRDLWWDLPAVSGSRTRANAVPVLGFLYFALMTVVELLRWSVRLLGRYVRSLSEQTIDKAPA